MKKFAGAACRQALVFAVAAALLLPATAQATPIFLSGINVSDAGQDAFEPQVAVDSSGNSLMVWTRSDGTNIRIQAKFRGADGTSGPTATISVTGRDASEPQVAFDPTGNAIAVWNQFDGSNSRIHAAFRPAGGSFGGDQTISPSGRDSTAPQIAIDSTGKAVAVWYRFDGATDRIQAAVRPANGSFGAVQTLSTPGQEAFEPKIAAGPNADANAVAVWTASDGTNLRVQSARRRDVAGYPRPKGASPLRASLVPAFKPCTSANRTHGAPLAYASCAPPQPNSSILTIGTPDTPGNGAAANFIGSVRFAVLAGNAATEADEADIKLTVSITDVRNNPSLTDYTGNVQVSANVQITDNINSAEMPEPGTGQPFNYTFLVPCATTTLTTVGSTCSTNTTADALVPNTILENRRAIWEIGQIEVKDPGPDANFGTSDDGTFARQGLYAP